MPSRSNRRAAVFGGGLLSGGLLIVSLMPAPHQSTGAQPLVMSLAERLTCARVAGDGWSPLPGVDYTGLLIVEVPPAPHGALQLVVSDAFPLDIDARSQVGPFPLAREPLRAGPGSQIPADLWLEAGGPWSLPPHVERVTVPARSDRAEIVEIALGRRAPRVLAKLVDYETALHTTVCAGQLDVAPMPRGGVIRVSAGDHVFFAAGWSPAEPDSAGRVVRWLQDAGVVLLPSEESGAVRLQIHASLPAAIAGETLPSLTVMVNDVWEGQPLPIRSDTDVYGWDIPQEAWVAGVNELLLRLSRAAATPHGVLDGRSLAVHHLVVQARDFASTR